jgi:hypothetical protein
MGLFCVALGVSLFSKKGFADVVDGLVASRALFYVTGIFTFLCGLLVVLTHNVWSGGLLPVLVTLIGWVSLLKGLFLMCICPSSLVGWAQTFKIKELYWLYAIVLVVIGAYLTYAGFMG